MKVNFTLLESSATFHSPAEAPKAVSPAQRPANRPIYLILFIPPSLIAQTDCLPFYSAIGHPQRRHPASGRRAPYSACVQVREAAGPRLRSITGHEELQDVPEHQRDRAE